MTLHCGFASGFSSLERSLQNTTGPGRAKHRPSRPPGTRSSPQNGRLRDDHACSLLQLLYKVRQIKELFLPLNFPILVELEEANTLQEEDMSTLGRET